MLSLTGSLLLNKKIQKGFQNLITLDRRHLLAVFLFV
nr:MAG TPA: hypothetical protein [Caudoviricetes sp.]